MATEGILSIEPGKFEPDSAEAWFTVLEAQFEVANVTTNSMKFYRTLSFLPPSTVKHLRKDVLDTSDYFALKLEVISVHEYLKLELLDKLITESSPAGRPSAVLRMIRAAASELGVGEDQVRQRFCATLPPGLAIICSSQKTTSLDEIGQLADRLLPLVKKEQLHNHHDGKMKQDENGLSLELLGDNRKGLIPFYPGQKPKVCRGHLYYGPMAHSCMTWCRWPDKTGVKIISKVASSDELD